MSSVTVVTAAVAIFVVATLLWHQAGASGIEGFVPGQQGIVERFQPAGGGFQNILKESNDPYFVPADLSQAPVHQSSDRIPTSDTRPITVPGPGLAPREAYASKKDMMELDSLIVTWLDAAGQRENNNPGNLTADQLQERIILQGRLANVRTQLGTGAITDTYKSVAQEIATLRRENAGWQQASPNLAALNSFAVTEPADAFLTPDLYAQFRGLFNAGLAEIRSQSQPNPLIHVRFQQLQVHEQDLRSAERQSAPNPPPIRVGAARLYLRQMLKVDQPLPTLFAMEPNPATQPTPLVANPTDVIIALQEIHRRYPVPAVVVLLQRMRANPTVQEVTEARTHVTALRNRMGPAAVPDGSVTGQSIQYDPSDIQGRARTLCKQITEAFPHDADALGCAPVSNDYEATTVINTVCDRLRYSVPSVSPEQFNCPSHAL